MSFPHRPAGRSQRRSPRNAWLILVAFAIPAALAVMGWSAAPSSQAQLAPDPKTCEGYPEKRIYLEAQSWWEAQAGPAEHPGTGRQGHIHVGTCFPLFQRLSGSSLRLDVFIQLHNLPSQVAYFSTDVETGKDGGTLHHQYYEFRRRCASADCNEWFSVDVPLAQLTSSGWATFRLLPHADTPDGKAQRVISDWWAYIDNGKSVHQSATPGLAGLGWFSPGGPAGKYSAVGFARSDLPWNPETGQAIPVNGLWQPRVGISRREALVLVDPALHASPPNFGTVVLSNSGIWDRTEKLSIDTTKLADGKHRVLIGGCDPRPDGKNCGVLVIPFIVNNAGAPAPSAPAPPTPTTTTTPTPPAPAPTPAPARGNLVLGPLQTANVASFSGLSRALAGRLLYTRVSVTDSATGASPQTATTTCDGLAGLIPVDADATYSGGYAVCVFRLPADSAGKPFKGAIRVTSGAAFASRSFIFRINAPTSAA